MRSSCDPRWLVVAGRTGQNFSQADFSYDTVVNVNDFTILASRFGLALADNGFQRTGERLPAFAAPFGGSRITDIDSDDDKLTGILA